MNKKNKKNDNTVLTLTNVITTIIFILLAVSIILLAVFGAYSKKDFSSKGLLGVYRFSDIFTPYDEYVARVSNEVNKTDAYVDDKGNVIREVPNNFNLPEAKLNNVQKKAIIKKREEAIDQEAKKYKIQKNVEIYDNKKEDITVENIAKSQETIIKKLRLNGIQNVRVRKLGNEQKGTNESLIGSLILQVPQDKQKETIFQKSRKTKEQEDKVKQISAIIERQAAFSLEDPDTGKQYVTEKNIKKVEKIIDTNRSVPIIFIRFTLDDEGKKQLEYVSSKYITEEKTVKDEKTGKDKKEKVHHPIRIKLANEKLFDTPLPKVMKDGVFDIPVINLGNKRYKIEATDTDKQKQEKIENAKAAEKEVDSLVSLFKLKKEPLVYKLEKSKTKEGIARHLNEQNVKIVLIVLLAIIVISSLALVFIGGFKGILAMLILISYISAIAVFIRFTNIILSLPAFVAIMTLYILEYILLYKTLKNIKQNNEENQMQTLMILISKTYILVVMSIVLSFSSNNVLSSFGMVLFVGQLLLFTHNFIFTKTLLKQGGK